MNILGFAGSLRKESFNKKLLKNAAEIIKSKNHSLEIFDLSEIPIYNQDVEDKGFPDEVVNFRKKIKEADCLLIASPEYNNSVSGVLKNAIDWGSRPEKQPFNGKTAAIMGASTGGFGTVRGQLHLREILLPLNVLVLPKPQLHVRNAEEVFDSEGNFKEDKNKKKLENLIDALIELAEKNNK